jgi:hypothetical protein
MTDTPKTPETDADRDRQEQPTTEGQRPDLAQPRGNPPTDEEAVRKGEEVLERVKPY